MSYGYYGANPRASTGVNAGVALMAAANQSYSRNMMLMADLSKFEKMNARADRADARAERSLDMREQTNAFNQDQSHMSNAFSAFNSQTSLSAQEAKLTAQLTGVDPSTEVGAKMHASVAQQLKNIREQKSNIDTLMSGNKYWSKFGKESQATAEASGSALKQVSTTPVDSAETAVIPPMETTYDRADAYINGFGNQQTVTPAVGPTVGPDEFAGTPAAEGELTAGQEADLDAIQKTQAVASMEPIKNTQTDFKGVDNSNKYYDAYRNEIVVQNPKTGKKSSVTTAEEQLAYDPAEFEKKFGDTIDSAGSKVNSIVRSLETKGISETTKGDAEKRITEVFKNLEDKFNDTDLNENWMRGDLPSVYMGETSQKILNAIAHDKTLSQEVKEFAKEIILSKSINGDQMKSMFGTTGRSSHEVAKTLGQIHKADPTIMAKVKSFGKNVLTVVPKTLLAVNEKTAGLVTKINPIAHDTVIKHKDRIFNSAMNALDTWDDATVSSKAVEHASIKAVESHLDTLVKGAEFRRDSRKLAASLRDDIANPKFKDAPEFAWAQDMPKEMIIRVTNRLAAEQLRQAYKEEALTQVRMATDRTPNTKVAGYTNDPIGGYLKKIPDATQHVFGFGKYGKSNQKKKKPALVEQFTNADNWPNLRAVTQSNSTAARTAIP